MKKALVLLLGLVSAGAFAENKAETAQPVSQPMLKMAVYDVSNKVAREVGSQYSISNKNHRLCWAAFNMAFDPADKNKVTLVFTAPNNKAKFVAPSGSTSVSADGKTSTVSMTIPSKGRESLENCWHFDHQDPLGKYTLTVRVNDTQFPATEFELVK